MSAQRAHPFRRDPAAAEDAGRWTTRSRPNRIPSPVKKCWTKMFKMESKFNRRRTCCSKIHSKVRAAEDAAAQWRTPAELHPMETGKQSSKTTMFSCAKLETQTRKARR